MIKNKNLLFCTMVFLSVYLMTGIDLFCQKERTNDLMIRRGALALPLKKNSSDYTLNIHVYNAPQKEYLCVEQSFKGFIDIYDLQTSKWVKAIQYPATILMSQPIGFFVNNFDSVYILLTRSNKLILLDSENRIIDTSIDLGFENNIYPLVLTEMPVIKTGDDLLLCGHFNPDAETPEKSSFIVYNINKNTKRPGYPRTKKYNIGWWGYAGSISRSFLAYNRGTKSLIISFPIDSYIYVYDLQGNAKKYYAGSKYIKDVPPFSKNKKDMLRYNSEVENHYAGTGTYSGITYDRYRNVYYRSVIKPTSNKEDFRAIRKQSLVILDKSFKILGEWDIPAESDYSVSFVSKKGLCVFNKQKYKQCEDTLCFDIYQINPSLEK